MKEYSKLTTFDCTVYEDFDAIKVSNDNMANEVNTPNQLKCFILREIKANCNRTQSRRVGLEPLWTNYWTVCTIVQLVGFYCHLSQHVINFSLLIWLFILLKQCVFNHYYACNFSLFNTFFNECINEFNIKALRQNYEFLHKIKLIVILELRLLVHLCCQYGQLCWKAVYG